MIELKPDRIKELFSKFQNSRVAVVGDLMLDSYMWGNVRRISPEAPVPVVEVRSETVKLGGAANVANNVLNLGAVPIPLGVVGDDLSGQQIRKLFNDLGIDSKGIIAAKDRPTTIKTRIIANDQHVVRADVESKYDILAETEVQILDIFKSQISALSGVILEDYNKGVLTPRLIKGIIAICRQHNVYVAVDPKFNNFFEYREVDLIKPNVRETEEALGIKINTDDELDSAAETIFERLNCSQIMITRGSKGMSLFTKADSSQYQLPTFAAKIHDVSGAGDTVIATFVVTKTVGASSEEAMQIANYAAAIVCGEVGVIPIEKDQLEAFIVNILLKK
ncbi:D-glycero-beta-D-manno-heptose-7-phosphate kinase [bacterium]|nr:D-glycero-beta-D-manno-heptose-7-phosphate kinase [bacterium]